MKRNFTLLIVLACLLCGFQMEAQEGRYVNQIFDDVTVTNDILYGGNTTVITVAVTGEVSFQPLVLDLYEPAGDTATDRPLVLYFHTGNFLPNPDNGSTSGTKTDSVNVEIATRLAKMGYVVAIPSYRQGWNPISDDQEVRVNTLINAAYRGVQDAHTCVRFFKRSVAESDNPYGVDDSKITLWGQGTGGYITLGTGTLDNYLDVVLPKFIGSSGLPMVIEQVNGDPFATTVGINPINGDTLCHPNHVGYDSEISLVVNMGGALGDTSWLDASDPPIISFQVPDDPFAPYNEDILIVPTTGDLIVEVQGANVIQQRANELGNHDLWKNTTFIDPYTASANEVNGGSEGLFPFRRAIGTNPLTGQPAPESSPWEWWDATFWTNFPHPSCGTVAPPDCSFHLINSINNQLMSAEQGRTYVDSIMGYYIPRACIALDLPCELDEFTGTDDIVDNAVSGLQLAPNPASQQVNISTNNGYEMLEVGIYNVEGKLVQYHNDLNTTRITLDRNGLTSGMYFAKIRFESGVSTSRIMFD